MIIVTKTREGQPVEVLCHCPSGSFWRPLGVERLMGMTSARQFPSEYSAFLAKEMMGGTEVDPDFEPGELPMFLRRQAGDAEHEGVTA
jgi:hypothetical protein